MKILFCNKYNYPFSGTEAYIFEAINLLRSRGHETALFSMADERGEPTSYDRYFVPHINFKQERRWFHKIGLAANAIYSWEARRRIRALVAEFHPDVAHVRNIYHHLSPSILWELKAQNVPVLYHINDFKVLCPSYNLVSRGEACEACKNGRYWRALPERCYPRLGGSAFLAAEAYIHRWIGTYEKCVDRFLAPSQFVRDKFIEHGWNASRFEVLPHFQRLEPVARCSEQNPALLYFGRLSREKGVDDLLHAMRRLPDLHLTIAGDGPERQPLQTLAAQMELRNVQFAGNLRGAELDQAIAESQFTVLPSHAYETFGKTILESYARGRAVIATDLGSRRELVHGGTTGLLYDVGNVDALVKAIQFLSSRPELVQKMGVAGYELVRKKYSPEAHYESLVALYERVADEKKKPFAALLRGSARQNQIPARKGVGRGAHGSDNFVPLRRLGHAAAGTPPSVAASAPKRELRVAFIGGRGVGSKYSGIETYYEEVGQRLVGMGHHVTAYCRTCFTPSGYGSPGAGENGIRIVRLPTIRTKHLETLLHTLLSTIHVLFSRCDVVHFHALGPSLFSFIPRMVGKKTVVTVQGLDWQRKKWGHIASAILKLGERAAASFPNRTIVVSRTLQEHYGGYASIAYVPNGGMLRARRQPKKILEWGLHPQRYLLFLGRFSPEKNCELLLDAFAKLASDVKLVMAGASSYCDQYARRIRRQAGEQIKILDWVSGEDLDELLTNAMIFVLPSDVEGLSLALLDAMGAGLCVVASDIQENREAIADAGFTFRHGDAADLADRLRFLIANPAVREAAGKAARRRIRDHYLWSNISTEVERVYFQIMGWEMPSRVPRKPSTSVPQQATVLPKLAG